MSDTPVTVHVCGAKCDQGGPPEDGGHVFDIEVEEDRASYARCKCGMSNMDWHAYWMEDMP